SAMISRRRLSRTRGPPAVSRIQPRSRCRRLPQKATATFQPGVCLLIIETIDGMQSANRKFGIGSVDQDRNLDLRRGDGADVDALFRKRLEGGRGDAGMA